MDAVRQVFVDNRQKAMAAHEDSLAPGGPHIMDMTVTNGGGRPRQAIATLPAQLLCGERLHLQAVFVIIRASKQCGALCHNEELALHAAQSLSCGHQHTHELENWKHSEGQLLS